MTTKTGRNITEMLRKAGRKVTVIDATTDPRVVADERLRAAHMEAQPCDCGRPPVKHLYAPQTCRNIEAGAGSAAPRLNAGSMSGRPALESPAAALRERSAAEVMAGGILLREDYLQKAVETAVAEAERLGHLAIHWEQRAIANGAKAEQQIDALAKALAALVEEVAPGNSSDSCLICGGRGEPSCCPEVTAAREALRSVGRMP